MDTWPLWHLHQYRGPVLSRRAFRLELLPSGHPGQTEHYELGYSDLWLRGCLLHGLLHFHWEESIHSATGKGAEILAGVGWGDFIHLLE